MSINNKNPPIRFKGFSEEWEEKTLGKVAVIKSGTSPSLFNKGDILYVKVDDLNYSTREQTYSKMKVDENIKSSIISVGSIIFPKRGAAIMTNKIRIMGNIGYIDTNMMALEPININSNFLFLFIYCTGLYKIADTSSIPQINNKHIEPYPISFPSLPEQTKIGDFFKSLDKLIAQNQQMYQKLQTIKKSLLQKMFPQKDSDKPKVRFKDFSEKWEEKTLGEVAEITMGQSPNGEYYTDNPNDYILVQGNADMYNGRVYPRVWTTQVTKTANIGDLILSVRAPVGDVGKTDYNIVIGRGVAAIKSNEFMFQFLTKINSDGYWKKYSAGSTFDSITSMALSKAFVSFPSLPEQTKIGNFFKTLDKLISLRKKEIEKLKTIKKAALEKMFV